MKMIQQLCETIWEKSFHTTFKAISTFSRFDRIFPKNMITKLNIMLMIFNKTESQSQ